MVPSRRASRGRVPTDHERLIVLVRNICRRIRLSFCGRHVCNYPAQNRVGRPRGPSVGNGAEYERSIVVIRLRWARTRNLSLKLAETL